VIILEYNVYFFIPVTIFNASFCCHPFFYSVNSFTFLRGNQEWTIQRKQKGQSRMDNPEKTEGAIKNGQSRENRLKTEFFSRTNMNLPQE
jgi:hypothetical protein